MRQLCCVLILTSLTVNPVTRAQDPTGGAPVPPVNNGEPQVFGACGPICQLILLSGERGSFLLYCDGTGKAQYSIDNYVCPDVTLEPGPRSRYPDGYVYYRDSTDKRWAIERRPCGYKQHKMWVQVKRHALDGGDNWEVFQVARLSGA